MVDGRELRWEVEKERWIEGGEREKKEWVEVREKKEK